MQLSVHGERFAHHLPQDAVAVRFVRQHFESGERVSREPVARLESLDRVVGELVLVPGDAQARGGVGVKGRQFLDVRVPEIGYG